MIIIDAKQTAQRYSLTSAQQAIWLDQLLHRSLPLYNIGGAISFNHAMDPSRFNQAVNQLIQQHDNLRLQLTDILDDTGLPQQTIIAPYKYQVSLQDLSQESNPHAAAQAWMQQRFVQPFVLQGAPLFRYDLVKVTDDHYIWLAQYHHLIIDGWSIALLNRSLGTLYTQLSVGEPLTKPSPSYVDFIAQDKAYLASTQYEQDKVYWLNQFKNTPDPLFKSPQIPTSTSGTATANIPRVVYQDLTAFAQQHHASVFQVLLGALTVYLARTQQQPALVIGLPTLNRSGAALKQTGGLFTGISPTVLQPDLDGTFVDYLHAIRQTLQASYRHQRFPVNEIHRAVQPTQVHHALYDVTLSYERHDYHADFAGQPSHTELLLHGHAQTPLTVYIRDFYTIGDVKVDFVYNQAYFDTTTIQALQSRWLHLLASLNDSADKPLSQLPVMTQAEYHQLQAWQTTPMDYPAQTVVDLFEQQVQRTPDNIAVRLDDQTLSYVELNTQANQVAHYLQGLTHTNDQPLVQPNTLIGLCVERSPAMLVGLLGILKAGAAYVTPTRLIKRFG